LNLVTIGCGFILGMVFGRGLFSKIFLMLIMVIPTAYCMILHPIIYYSLRVTKEDLTPDCLTTIRNS
jgi:hypothetical protein